MKGFHLLLLPSELFN